MSGSNGSSAHRGGQAPQAWPPETEEQARALEYARWQQQQAQQAQQGYAPDPVQHLPAQQQYGGYAQPAPAQSYGYDPQQPPAGYVPQAHDPAAHYGQPPVQHGYAEPAPVPQPRSSHAPQFERFSPVPQPGPDAYGRYAATAPQTGYPAANPHDPHALGVPHDPHGYAQPAGQQHAAPIYPGPHDADPRQTQARADVQSWDLSNYAPGQIPPGYGGHDPRAQQMRPQAAPGAHDAQWQQPAGGAHWPQQAGPGAHGYDAPQHGHYQPRPGEPGYQPGGLPQDDGYEPDEAMPPEEKSRGPGTMMIVGALVGAIAVGGGLAYGYKMLGGGIRDKGKPPVVKAEANPARTVPKDAGGKTMDNLKDKFLNRLATDPAPAPTTAANADAAARTGDVDGTAKKVTSIPITLNRDGTLSPQAARPPEPVAAPNSGVPGLVIDGLGPPPGAPVGPPLRGASGQASGPATSGPVVRAIPPPPPLPPPPAVKAVTQPTVRPVAAAPKVADLPLPKVIAQQPPAQAEPAGPPKGAARTPVPKKAAAVRDDLLAAQGAAPNAAVVTPAAPDGAVRKGSVVATGASGYVAVLASKQSRQDALNSFADLHQKFPDILTGMTPDVREADLKEKGLWYRLIVGPPGSQQAARTLCVKLSERGMKDCWPVAY